MSEKPEILVGKEGIEPTRDRQATGFTVRVVYLSELLTHGYLSISHRREGKIERLPLPLFWELYHDDVKEQ